MADMYEYSKALAEASKRGEWDRWCRELPRLEFPPTWAVKIMPPFAGAIIRFYVTRRGCAAENPPGVSVYFDGYDCLGYVRQPYWEIYPSPDGEDVERYMAADVAGLMAGIEESLANQEKREKV